MRPFFLAWWSARSARAASASRLRPSSGKQATPTLTEQAIGFLISLGYTVAHNKPYAGGFITEHYGRPSRGLHALQIEVNRGLYMNERTLQKSSGFDLLAGDLARFVADLMAIPDYHFTGLPLAAE